MTKKKTPLEQAIDRIIRDHASPLPDYATAAGDGDVDRRFKLGSVDVAKRPCDGDDLRRPGFYCGYAVRRSLIVETLPELAPIPMHWVPAVWFIPDDLMMKPERAYDGDPLTRRVRPVPVDTQMSPKAVLRKVFGHLTGPHAKLAAYYKRTGERWEVLREQERRRCEAAGEPFAMPELPDGPLPLPKL